MNALTAMSLRYTKYIRIALTACLAVSFSSPLTSVAQNPNSHNFGFTPQINASLNGLAHGQAFREMAAASNFPPPPVNAVPGGGNAFGVTSHPTAPGFMIAPPAVQNAIGPVHVTGNNPEAALPRSLPQPVAVPKLAASQPSAGTDKRVDTRSNGPTPATPAVPAPPVAPMPVYQGTLEQGIPGVHMMHNALTETAAADAAIGSSSRPVHVVAAPGSIYKQTKPSVLELTSGQLLISSRQKEGAVTVRAANGREVQIAKAADVLVSADGETLRVQNLTGMGKNVEVKLPVSPQAHQSRLLTVDPGFEVIAKRHAVKPADILVNDGVGRRNAVVANNGSFGVSEVSIPSLIASNNTLRSTLKDASAQSWQKQLTNDVLKVAASISTVRGEPPVIPSPGREVAAAAHAAQEAGTSIAEAVHTAIAAAHGLTSAPGPPPPPPPPTPPPVAPPPIGGGSGSSRNTPVIAVASVSGTIFTNQTNSNGATQSPLSVAITIPPSIDTTRPRVWEMFNNLGNRPQSGNVARPQQNTNGAPFPLGPTAPIPPANFTQPPAANQSAGTQPSYINGTGLTQGERESNRTAEAAAAARAMSGRPHIPFGNIPPLVEETIRQHPDYALIFGIAILSLLGVTAYFAYVAHRRALAIESQMRELNLLNRQLQDARDQAIEATRLKSQFVANISHEIRTPISAVLGTIGLLFGTKLDENQKEIAGVLKESARSLLDVINDILDFSKIEAGMLQVQAAEFSPAELVKEVVDLIRVAATEKDLNLVTVLDPQIPGMLRGDSMRLRQILLNLANNAVKFTAAGTVTIKALQEKIEDDRLWLRFIVEDTGIGISEEAKERLFQPFVQADGSTTRQFGGTGLGLSISKRLAELLGGKITLESTPGSGSEFSLVVPFQLPSAAAQIAPPAVMPPAVRSTCGVAHKRILVAEDSPVLQRIIKTQLEQLGCEPTIVSNGAEAVEAALSGNFNLILMDWQMPAMDGLEATRAIRSSALEGAANMPIIAMTANAMEGHKDTCLAAGMNDYISKPFTPEQLEHMLAQWLPADEQDADNPKAE